MASFSVHERIRQAIMTGCRFCEGKLKGDDWHAGALTKACGVSKINHLRLITKFFSRYSAMLPFSQPCGTRKISSFPHALRCKQNKSAKTSHEVFLRTESHNATIFPNIRYLENHVIPSCSQVQTPSDSLPDSCLFVAIFG